MQNVLEQALTCGFGSIQHSFHTIVFTQCMQRCFKSKYYYISVKFSGGCTLVLLIQAHNKLKRCTCS